MERTVEIFSWMIFPSEKIRIVTISPFLFKYHFLAFYISKCIEYGQKYMGNFRCTFFHKEIHTKTAYSNKNTPA